MMCGGIIGDICPSGYSCTAPPTAGASGHCIINAFVDTNQKRCRLVANPASETCSPPNSPTPTITPVISLTPSVTPSVTPVISLTPSPTLAGPTPSNTPVPTIPPGITVNPTTPGLPPTYKVVTTLNCNGSCSKNSDCSNISHICYNGKCRLDANPESTRCVLVTGETSVVINVIPTRTPGPAELTKTGPADWANYLKVGFGALGVGALLLLFL